MNLPQLPKVIHDNQKPLLALLTLLAVSWLLTKTSSTALGNLPAAALLLLGAKLLLRANVVCTPAPGRHTHRGGRDWRRGEEGGAKPQGVRFEQPPGQSAAGAGAAPPPRVDQWRELVQAPVVAHAWETLCGSIVQEFIYDTWFAGLSPDKEFPAEVRRLLNGAFGQLAARSRMLDLRDMLNDASELFMEQIELFRDTRDSILASHGPRALVDMTPAARDRAFRREMRAEKNLHPALQAPDGHYKFLRAVAEGVVSHTLGRVDLQHTAIRVVCRELLAGVVLRPLMMWCTPYYANKGLYTLLKERAERVGAGALPPGEEAEALAAAKTVQMRGNFEFEQRARKSAAAEDSALLEARMTRSRLRQSRSSVASKGGSSSQQRHQRSRSADLSADREHLATGEVMPADHQQQQQQQWGGSSMDGGSPGAELVGSPSSLAQRRTVTLPPQALSQRLAADISPWDTAAGPPAAADRASGPASRAGSSPQRSLRQVAAAGAWAGTPGAEGGAAAAAVAAVGDRRAGGAAAGERRAEGAAVAVAAGEKGGGGAAAGEGRGGEPAGAGGGASSSAHPHSSPLPVPSGRLPSAAGTNTKPAWTGVTGKALQSWSSSAEFQDASDAASILLGCSPLSLPPPPQAKTAMRSSLQKAPAPAPVESPSCTPCSAPRQFQQHLQQQQLSPQQPARQPADAVPTAAEVATPTAAGTAAAAAPPAESAVMAPQPAASAAAAEAPAIGDLDLRDWEHIPPSPSQPRADAAGTAGSAGRLSSGVAAAGLGGGTASTRGEGCASGHLLAAAVDATAVESNMAVASSLAASTSSLEPGDCPSCRPGFVGHPRAKVVAADLNASGSKDYVTYKIRVSDDGHEWTVSRRFRNFETLHKQLRALPTYRLKLPAKRIFTHSQTVDFVEERREALDKYLEAALANNVLLGSSDLWEFLRPDSELYELQPSPGFFKSFTTARSNDTQRKKSGLQLPSVLAESMRGVADSVRGMAGAKGAGTPGSPSGELRWGSFSLMGRRQSSSKSVPRDLSLLDRLAGPLSPALQQPAAGGACAPSAAGAAGDAGPSSWLPPPGAALAAPMDSPKAAGAAAVAAAGAAGRDELSGRSRGASRHSMEVLGTANKGPADLSTSVASDPGTGSETVLPARSFSSKSFTTGRSTASAAGLLSRAAKKMVVRSAASSNRLALLIRVPSQPDLGGDSASGGSPTKRGFFKHTKSNTSKSPTKERSPRRAQAGEGAETSSSGSFEAPLAGNPSQPLLAAASTSPKASARSTGSSSLRDNSTPARGNPSSTLPQQQQQQQQQQAGPIENCLEFGESAGISAPLYEIVDCVFQLQTRGFFRRQVFSVARQMLSLVAGDTIDVYLSNRLRQLRQEHTIARVMQSIQSSLWPGGIWFQYLPQYQRPPKTPPSTGTGASASPAAHARQLWTMQAEKYLEPGAPPPLDEEEIREAVYELMLSRAPSALVRLVGRNTYVSGMEDLFGMLQSPTFVQQLGYGLLEIAVVNLVPELKPLFRKMEREGVA